MRKLSGDNGTRNTKSRDLFVYTLVIIAIPSYIWCASAHICMAGHLQHPPYPAIQWVSDALWAVCMVIAAAYAVRSGIKRKVFFIIALAVLFISRILGSLGGVALIIEYTILLWIGLEFLVYLFSTYILRARRT